MLTEVVFSGIFQGKNAEKFSLQFCDEFLVFDDVMLLVSAYMYPGYVFICNRDCIADEENGLLVSTHDVIVAGTDVSFREIKIKIQPLQLSWISMI